MLATAAWAGNLFRDRGFRGPPSPADEDIQVRGQGQHLRKACVTVPCPGRATCSPWSRAHELACPVQHASQQPAVKPAPPMVKRQADPTRSVVLPPAQNSVSHSPRNCRWDEACRKLAVPHVKQTALRAEKHWPHAGFWRAGPDYGELSLWQISNTALGLGCGVVLLCITSARAASASLALGPNPCSILLGGGLETTGHVSSKPCKATGDRAS